VSYFSRQFHIFEWLRGRKVTAVQQIKDVKEKIVGLKQTLRAMQQGKVKMVYVADDIEEHVLRKISDACRETNVPLKRLGYCQCELGRFCQIEVGAAVVALLK
jgi:large subunit ribosomal protein L7A